MTRHIHWPQPGFAALLDCLARKQRHEADQPSPDERAQEVAAKIRMIAILRGTFVTVA